MTKREKLEAKIAANKAKINTLKSDNFELQKAALLLSDDVQWFVEQKEMFGRGRGKKEMLIGRIHWMEDFMDEDTGKAISIEREEVVRIDGRWLTWRLVQN